jgi:serine/threonine-protein kinase
MTHAPEALPPDEISDLVGRLIGGRYTVEQLLGEGDRKRTYLARDIKVQDRLVALSIVKLAAIALDPHGTQREADVLGRIGHNANIVSFHDAATEGSLQYIVFQYLSGGTLADYVGRLTAQGEVLSNEQILRFSRQLGRALSHIHGRGVLHRDVSPQNVWLDQRWEAHLGDFDSAVVAGSDEKIRPLTTDAFASPEERHGGHIDHRSDLFSLGRVIAFLMTGDLEAGRGHLDTRRTRPDLPLLLHDLVGRLLAESADDRPVDANSVLRELDEARRSREVRLIIAEGEGERVEFKSSLCHPYKVASGLAPADWNVAVQTARPALEKAVLKSIAAFLNSNGGTLLVGVDPAGTILGIEADFEMVGGEHDADAWQQYFRDRVLVGLGRDVWSSMRLSLERLDGQTVARVECIPRGSATWLKMPADKQHEFYVRSGSVTDLLSGPDAVRYIVETRRAGTR